MTIGAELVGHTTDPDGSIFLRKNLTLDELDRLRLEIMLTRAPGYTDMNEETISALYEEIKERRLRLLGDRAMDSST